MGTAGNTPFWQNGAPLTDEIATKFRGHEMCSTDEWLVSPEWFAPPARAERASQIGHPSDWGHQMMAEVVTPLLPRNVHTRNGTVMTQQQDDGGRVPAGGEDEPPSPEERLPGSEQGDPAGGDDDSDENEP